MNRIQAQDIRPGMIVATTGGQGSAVRNMWTTKARNGSERINFTLANDLVITRVHPTDPIEMHDPRSSS